MIFSVVLAAGKGERFGGKKVYEKIGDISVLEFSVSKLLSVGTDVMVLAIRREDTDKVMELLSLYDIGKVIVTEGGETRWDSFQNAFSEIERRCSLKDDDIIIEHDAARPLFSVKMLREMILTLRDDVEGVIPFVRPVDTVRIIEHSGIFLADLPRESVALIQTPQVFKAGILRELMNSELSADDKFADLAGLFLKVTRKVKGVEGERRNIKITFKEDLLIAEALVSEEDIKIVRCMRKRQTPGKT